MPFRIKNGPDLRSRDFLEWGTVFIEVDYGDSGNVFDSYLIALNKSSSGEFRHLWTLNRRSNTLLNKGSRPISSLRDVWPDGQPDMVNVYTSRFRRDYNDYSEYESSDDD